jgi:hypothetical protein
LCPKTLLSALISSRKFLFILSYFLHKINMSAAHKDCSISTFPICMPFVSFSSLLALVT